MSDATTIAMWAVNLLISAGITIVLFRVSQTTKQLHRMEDKRDQDVKAIREELAGERAQLHVTAEKLVDERFRRISHELASSVQGLVGTIDEMKDRLRNGESGMAALLKDDNELRVRLERETAEVRRWVLERMIRREDFDSHANAVNGKLDKLMGTVAELCAKREGA